MSAMTNSSESNEPNPVFPSDRDLLRRFIHDGDEASFAAIVERHASLVMSVCRRVVGQSPDVDDAFQATFFALSKRPASIYECGSLSGWLYSVAWRASVRLVRLRNRTMTQPLPDEVSTSGPDPLDVIAEANDLASLDEELNQLPEKYRDVLVMSYFAQQTNQEIADQLNETKGAIDGRIRDARRILRVRLARRGVEIGVLAVAVASMQSSASAASPALIQKAISLGAPGLASQEFADLNAAEIARLNSLTSTGATLMSKIGLTFSAGLLLATGLWGMTQLRAFQDAAGAGSTTVALDATAGALSTADESATEVSGRTEGAVSAAATDGVGEMSVTKPARRFTGAAAEFSRQSERDAERRLNELMQSERAPALNFPGENALTAILECMRTHLAESQGTTVVFKPDTVGLDFQGVSEFDDISVRDIEIPENFMTMGSALDYILSTADPEMTWIAKNELYVITTKEMAEQDENMFLRSYDISLIREISQLTATTWETQGFPGGGMGGGGFFSMLEPSQMGGALGGGGMAGAPQAAMPRRTKTQPSKPKAEVAQTEEPADEIPVVTWESGLLQTIQEMTSPPCRWHDMDGEGGKMSIAGNRLIVRQSRKGHEQVVAVLEQLELAAEDVASEHSSNAPQ